MLGSSMWLVGRHLASYSRINPHHAAHRLMRIDAGDQYNR